ncbi:hypothetical protein ACI2OX_17975 [Bacillus sp. N9]
MMEHLLLVFESLEQGKVKTDVENVKVYERSHTKYDQVQLVMVKDKKRKAILAVGNGPLFDELEGELLQENKKYVH